MGRIHSDDRLNQFADRLLSDRRVIGYRRYEVVGQGLGFRRNGSWWTMTVDDDYSVADLVEVYHDFWKTGGEGSIYVEILRSGEGKHIK